MIEIMRDTGITTKEAIEAAGKLAAAAAANLDYETEVKNIRNNPSLKMWEKHKIIKELKKMKTGQRA